MWVQQVVSCTDLNNFLKLRFHGMAEPHFQELAGHIDRIKDFSEFMFQGHDLRKVSSQEKGTWQVLFPGEWHLPYLTDADLNFGWDIEQQKAVAAGRCGRVSFYLPEEGDRASAPGRDADRARGFSENGHWSPLEHVATPTEGPDRVGNFHGWKQWRKFFEGEDGGDAPT
jgi:hypothetical protein